jgi:hypothetical protein
MIYGPDLEVDINLHPTSIIIRSAGNTGNRLQLQQRHYPPAKR